MPIQPHACCGSLQELLPTDTLFTSIDVQAGGLYWEEKGLTVLSWELRRIVDKIPDHKFDGVPSVTTWPALGVASFTPFYSTTFHFPARVPGVWQKASGQITKALALKRFSISID